MPSLVRVPPQASANRPGAATPCDASRAIRKSA